MNYFSISKLDGVTKFVSIHLHVFTNHFPTSSSVFFVVHI
jgi:hypothetical protein